MEEESYSVPDTRPEDGARHTEYRFIQSTEYRVQPGVHADQSMRIIATEYVVV